MNLHHRRRYSHEPATCVYILLRPPSSRTQVLSAERSPNSFFKTLVDHEVTVELKNDIQIKGTLKSVDQFLNIKLDDIQVVEEIKYPHLVSRDRIEVNLSFV